MLALCSGCYVVGHVGFVNLFIVILATTIAQISRSHPQSQTLINRASPSHYLVASQPVLTEPYTFSGLNHSIIGGWYSKLSTGALVLSLPTPALTYLGYSVS